MASYESQQVISQVPPWHIHPDPAHMVPLRGNRAMGGKALALPAATWQCRRMSQGRKNPTGAGAFIALLILGGTIGGGLLGQPSIGLLTGLALGVILALILWLRERDR